MNSKILVVLQNAWASRPSGQRLFALHSQHWLKALEKSRSGKRLKVLLGDDCYQSQHIKFTNTTPKVASRSYIKLKPDTEWLTGIINEFSPSIIIACGNQARNCCVNLWSGPLLCIPHPCYRLLTNDLLYTGKNLLSSEFDRRIALKQRIDHVAETPILDDVEHDQLSCNL